MNYIINFINGISFKKKKAIEHFSLVLVVGLFVFYTFFLFKKNNIYDLYQAVNTFIVLISLLFSTILYVCCVFSYDDNTNNQRFYFELLDMALMINGFIKCMEIVYEGKPENSQLILICYSIDYLIASIYWACFWYYQKAKCIHKNYQFNFDYLFWIFNLLYIFLIIYNYFTQTIFYVDEAGNFMLRSYLIYFFAFINFIFYLIYVFLSQADFLTKCTFASYVLTPMLISGILMIYINKEFTWNISGCLTLLFYVIPLYFLFFNVYIRNSYELARQKRELAESRINASVLQINPHFISNTLNSIAALCELNPEEAKHLTVKFSKYLRSNYVDLLSDSMVSFQDEIDNIKNYLEIEKVRFPNIQVIYDIQADSFNIPSLTLQPLVENAMKHGIEKKKDVRGIIKISSFESEKEYNIIIEDDGIGFDESKNNDGEKHIGIINSKTRLDLMCKGTLKIESKLGIGTKCYICIPKEG